MRADQTAPDGRWRALVAARAARRDGLPTVLRRNPELQPSLEDQGEFDAALLRRYDIDAAPDDVQDCLFDLRWRGKMLFGKLFTPGPDDVPFSSDRIVYDFIDRLAFSAYVKPSSGSPAVYHVGMYVGLVARLYRAAYALMSLGEVLPELGNSRAETASEAEVAARVFGTVERNSLLHDRVGCPLPSAVFADLRPKDFRRHFFAHALVAVALQWFYYHEFHHVWGGHLRLLQTLKTDARGPLGFDESEEPYDGLGSTEVGATGDPEFRYLLRLIEFDADKRAARRMLHPLMNDLVMLNAVNLNEVEKPRLVEAWALMLGALFLQLNPRPTEDLRAEDREHPHPEVRFWGVFVAFADGLSEQQIPHFHDCIRRSLRLLNRLWEASGGSGNCYSNSRTRAEEVIGEVNRLGAAVNQELYPRLLPYDVDQLLAAREGPPVG